MPFLPFLSEVTREPNIDYVSPLVGVLAGGTHITLTGTGLSIVNPVHALFGNSRKYTAPTIQS